ncbi:MAG: UDP-N-acetylmuramate--L-alanine ligase [Patescibacteria group bacterium]|jgi:UDP-N-acetylmuramate--alanine ligase
MTNILSAGHVHCLGIGGIGVSGLARLLHWRGIIVTGSDLRQSIVTDDMQKLGVKVWIGPHDSSHVPPDAKIIVHTVATSQDNVELAEARRRGLTVITYPEAVGQLTEGKRLITVSGTHGKTTTTAMIGQLLIAAGLDPTVLVGSRLASIDGNARNGQGDYFVLEGDEYGRAFLNYHPEIAVITNIESDHLDVYRDIDDIKETFVQFLTNIKPNGTLVFNHDDANVLDLAKHFKGHAVSFGLSGGNYLGLIQGQERGAIFNEAHTGTIRLAIPGSFNVSNALAAISVGQLLGIKPDLIVKTLGEFAGLWRRFEIVGEHNGAIIISDYAHHPTAVRATVAAARQYFPDRHLLVAFQPHHRHRTKALFNDFVDALSGIDKLILQEIYDVAGRETDSTQDVSSRQLLDVLRQHGNDGIYCANDADTEATLKGVIKPNDVVLIMGAGTIDTVARNLVKQ